MLSQYALLSLLALNPNPGALRAPILAQAEPAPDVAPAVAEEAPAAAEEAPPAAEEAPAEAPAEESPAKEAPAEEPAAEAPAEEPPTEGTSPAEASAKAAEAGSAAVATERAKGVDETLPGDSNPAKSRAGAHVDHDAKAGAAEDAPERINPRPEGEEVLLDDHAVNNNKAVFNYGNGLKFKSEDEKFSMAIRMRVQFRDEMAIEQVDDDGDGDEESAFHNTFGLRRARLQFKGNVFGKHNKYKAEFAFSPKDLAYEQGTVGRTPLLSYYAEFTQLRDLSLRIGQYKLYYNRQRVISSGNQEFVDRTEAQGEFNLDRDVGMNIFSKDLFGLGKFKYYTGVSVGEGRDIWTAENLLGEGSGYQFLGRVEYLPFGKFDDYSEVDFKRLNRVRMSIGGAYAFLKNGRQTRGYRGDPFADGGTADFHNVNADVLLKWAGMTLFSEFYYRDGSRNGEVVDLEDNLTASGMGGSIQAGYLVPGLPLGVGARYSGVGPGPFDDDETGLGRDNEVGGTVGWYFAGHPLKLQADYFHLWGDDFSQDAAERVRIQLQVAY